MSCWALVPIKARADGKRRLSAVLEADERAELVSAMLAHVLAVLQRCSGIDHIAVMSPKRDDLAEDVLWLQDSATEVNEALRGALRALVAHGAQRIAIVSADLPCLAPDDVQALLAANQTGTVALAPDRHGSGTNALALEAASAFVPQFGTGSLSRHLREARRVGATPILVRRAGLAFDLDEPEDLALLRQSHGPRQPAPAARR